MRTMTPGDASGFTMAELIVVVAIIGILAAFALPMFLSYYQGATLRAGSEEVFTILNTARQLAISSNSTVCVTTTTTSAQYHVGACGNAAYVGPGTDSAGNITLTTAVQITNNPQVAFSYLGGAITSGVYSVRNPADGRTQTVTVTASGRITVP
jgi:prepilin-type N-terminal cleavage/methylation domain-containing protein